MMNDKAAEQKLPAVEEALRVACRKAAEQGYTLLRSVTLDGKNCCAIGAYAATTLKAPLETGSIIHQVADELGVRGGFMAAFADGFDGKYYRRPSSASTETMYFDLGVKLGDELLGPRTTLA